MKIAKEQLKKYGVYGAAILAVLAACAGFIWYLFRGLSFANPGFMYLIILLLIAAAVAGMLKYLFVPAVKYPLPKNIKIPFSPLPEIVKWLPFSLCVFASLLCIFALARPRHEGKTIIPPNKGIDIMMTIDTSGSMDALDFTPNRMGAAKVTAEEFIHKRSTDRIGIVVFSDTAMLQCPLTLDYFALNEYVKMIQIGMLGGTGTAIGDAIAVATRHLKDSATKSKVIILITDGESNSGTVDPMAAAKAADSYGIKIYTIAIAGTGEIKRPVNTFFGTQYANVPPTSDVGETLLMEISKMTGGEFFRAKNNLELQNIYNKINELEKTDFKETIQLNYKDAYASLLIWAIILLGASFILDKFVFVKIP